MATVSVADDILRDCARGPRPVADYQLEPALDRRLRDLGETSCDCPTIVPTPRRAKLNDHLYFRETRPGKADLPSRIGCSKVSRNHKVI